MGAETGRGALDLLCLQGAGHRGNLPSICTRNARSSVRLKSAMDRHHRCMRSHARKDTGGGPMNQDRTRVCLSGFGLHDHMDSRDASCSLACSGRAIPVMNAKHGSLRRRLRRLVVRRSSKLHRILTSDESSRSLHRYGNMWTNGTKGLMEIGHQVFGILQPDRQPHKSVSDAELRTLFPANPLVSGGGRVCDQ